VEFTGDDCEVILLLKEVRFEMIKITIKHWLPLAVALTLVFGVLYVAIQQTLRLGANDPQIQMAEDISRALAAGQSLETLAPADKVDIAQSLAPYLIVYDAQGKVLRSSASLHGQIPELPQGVLDAARQMGENRITWQPEAGVRSAVVIAAVSGGQGGFVLAGRSLREAEKRIDLLGLQVGLGWAASLVFTLILVLLLNSLPFLRSR
jgi:hypothetical protein